MAIIIRAGASPRRGLLRERTTAVRALHLRDASSLEEEQIVAQRMARQLLASAHLRSRFVTGRHFYSTFLTLFHPSKGNECRPKSWSRDDGLDESW